MGEEEDEVGKAWEQAGLQTSQRNSVGLSSVLLYVHNTKTVRTVRDGEPRTSTSTFTQLLTQLVGR